VRIEHDPVTNQAYLHLVEIGPGQAVTQVPVFEKEIHLVLDLDAEGRLIGIDLLNAAASLPRELLNKVDWAN
jgi:uncharacterized protein YuzE